MSSIKKFEALEILTDADMPAVIKFNQLLMLFTQHKAASFSQVQFYNRSGYNTERLKQLEYDLKKVMDISKIDVATYEQGVKNVGARDLAPVKPKEEENTVLDLNEVATDLAAMSDDTKGGYQLRKEFPFLADKDCPDEFKVLVSDKITAFHDFLEKHKELSVLVYGDPENGIAPSDLSNEELLVIGKEITEDYINNELIYEELNYYKEHGQVLGKHEKLQGLLAIQEVNAMTLAELRKNLKNYKQYNSRDDKKILKAKTEDRRQTIKALIADRTDKMKLMEERVAQLEAQLNADESTEEE
jgi:hypothetical protein